MRLNRSCFLVTLLAIAANTSLTAADSGLVSSLKLGTPQLQSAGPIAFGPEGILFVGDARGAAVFAIATRGGTIGETGSPIAAVRHAVTDLSTKIGALLGTQADGVKIQDLAIHPDSGNAYLSVTRGQGPDATPVLVRVRVGGKLDVLSLKNVHFARAELPNAPAPDELDRRRRPKRLQSITDVGYVDGKVLVAGLSNEEFASTLRAIAFPFKKVDGGSSVEIYHGAHGKFETRSPVRTFLPYDIEGEAHLLAAYTCTPLVRIPLAELRPGAHVKGTTIAELGNHNRPLDMISYKKGGKPYLLLANDRRGVMKMAAAGLDGAGIVEKVKGVKGVEYETVASWKGIVQLDRLGDAHAVVVRAEESGTTHLETLQLP
jgi:hypothetical protein